VLVLSRKQGESVVIGNDILVTVLEVRGDQIRLGIDAPRSITVHRQEVYLQVARENSAAIASSDRESPLLRRPVHQAVVKPDPEPPVPQPGQRPKQGG
jgi:carbon storage regulator